MEDCFVSHFGNWKVWKRMQEYEWKIIVTRIYEGKGANYEWRMEDCFVSYFGNWKVWKRMQVEWKIIVTRIHEGKGLLRIMNGG